jgi:phytoene dehydrogenase-like protein
VAGAHDIAIIGAGHNGLVAAFFLARAGFKPLVLERRPIVGGIAVTEEFHPGFRCSTLMDSAGMLLPAVLSEMQLERHGLQWIEPEASMCALSPDGPALVLANDPAKSAEQIRKFSSADAAKYAQFHGILSRIGRALHPLLRMTPPGIDKPSVEDLWGLVKIGRGIRKLGKKDMLSLLRWGPMAVADFAAEWFENELLRAAVAARGIFGTAAGPWSPGSTAPLLLRVAADGNPTGRTLFPRGGMGALAQAMAESARKVGAEIRTSAEVQQILVKDGAVRGIVLADGEEIPLKAVVSNADPRRTLLRLVDPVHFAPGFLVKMQHYRCQGVVAKINLALVELPRFTGLNDAASSALSGRIHLGPEIDYLERAFDASKYGNFSEHPYLEVTIPTISDPSLAPPGRHVMSVFMQFAPYRLRNNDWSCRREALADTVLKTLAEYAPNLSGLVLGRQVVTPEDIEETYGLTGGHLFHGELALDQLFTMRPLLGWARYRTPVRGLYLCGSGTHPGIGVTGASGFNAAREILKDLRR